MTSAVKRNTGSTWPWLLQAFKLCNGSARHPPAARCMGEGRIAQLIRSLTLCLGFPQSHDIAGISPPGHLPVALRSCIRPVSRPSPRHLSPERKITRRSPTSCGCGRLEGMRNRSAQETDEPPWRQAFVLAEGVKATRTPDRVIRARNGHPEPLTTGPEDSAPAADAAGGKPVSSVIGEEAIEAPEPTIRSQIAELRSALASEDPVSERLTLLADKEAALADGWRGEAAGASRRMIETATRFHFHSKLQPRMRALSGTKPRIQLEPTRHVLQLGVCSGLVLVAGHLLRIGWYPPAGDLDALSAVHADGPVFLTPAWRSMQHIEVRAIQMRLSNRSMAPPSKPRCHPSRFRRATS